MEIACLHCRLTNRVVDELRVLLESLHTGPLQPCYTKYLKALFIAPELSRIWCYEQLNEIQLEFGMYPQSMPTEWTHARTVRPWQSVRLDL